MIRSTSASLTFLQKNLKRSPEQQRAVNAELIASYRSHGVPARLYAEGRSKSSYRDQDLTLARCFRRSN